MGGYGSGSGSFSWSAAANQTSGTRSATITVGTATLTVTQTDSLITILGNTGIGGVALGGLPGNPVSDGSGNYSTSVTNGWSGTVTPAKTGYAFIPASERIPTLLATRRARTTATQLGPFTISGNTGTGGVTLIGLPGNPVSDGSGNYSASVGYGWSGTVTPAKTGYAFIPASRTYTNVTRNQTGQDSRRRNWGHSRSPGTQGLAASR